MSIGSKIFLTLTVATFAGCAARPPANDTFLNLSFEHGTPQGYPLAWYIETDAEHARVGIDSERSHNGRRSLRIQNDGDQPVVLYTPLLAGPHCLETIEVQASMLTASPEIEVSLFFLLPGEPPLMGEAARAPLDGWRTLGASLASDNGCLSTDLMLGILVQGRGEIWIDGMRLATSNPDYFVSDIPPHAAPSGEALNFIARHAIEPDTLNPAEELHDLEPLAALFDTARIVGLRENSHGARALFQLKHRMTRFLVEKMGFTILALEMPAQQAKVVNDYVLSRNNDERAALLALTYPSWQSEEMWAVIEWLRAYNRTAMTPVTFYGLDTPADDRNDDQRMADEAERIMNDAPADARMIIWADNTHVTKHGRAMGAWLAGRYGKLYIAVGTTFNEGHYLAYGPKQRYEAHPGYPGTHEHVLAQVKGEVFLLDLAALPSNHVLREAKGFRYIGSMPQELHQFYPHRLTEHFDVIGFVRRTDSTRLLLEHEF